MYIIMKMKIKNDYELFLRASPAKTGTKFLSYLVDAFILFLTSYLIFLGGYNIYQSTNLYQETDKTFKEEISYYETMIKETHLVSFTENVRNENDVFALDNISKMLIYSDEKYNWYENGVEHAIIKNGKKYKADTLVDAIYKMNSYGDNETRTEYVASSYESDDIAYFYTNYAKNHNENDDLFPIGNLTYEEYYQNQFEKYIASDLSIYFNKLDDGSFPYVLKMDKAINLFNYYFLENDPAGIGKQGFSRLTTLYSNLQQEAEKTVLNGKIYLNEHYSVYQNALNTIGNSYCLIMVLSILISYLLVIVVPMLIFKNGVTIGKKCLGLGIIEQSKDEIIPWKLAIRCVLGLIGYLGFSLLIPILPPFAGSYTALYSILFKIGNFDVNLMTIDLIIMGISIINGVLSFITHYKTSLIDLMLKENVVDKNHLDEGDYDERDETSL